jgi:hypothetical protein
MQPGRLRWGYLPLAGERHSVIDKSGDFLDA